MLRLCSLLYAASMLLAYLSRVPQLRGVLTAELHGLVRSSRLLCIPANRWLMQCGGNLGAYLFLLKGRMQTLEPDRCLRAGASLHHFYPGCRGAKTISVCQILSIEAAHFDFITGRQKDGARVHEGEDTWLTRFLSSRMMAGLPQADWQRLLKDAKPFEVSTGETVIHYGAVGGACFIVENGLGHVHRQGQTLRWLGPGDFFGEDAILSNRFRNADITALEPMRLHAIAADKFVDVAVPALVPVVEQVIGGVRLNIGADDEFGATRVDVHGIRELIETLDPAEHYIFVGGRVSDRLLCAFLLRQQGLQASVIAQTMG